MSASAFLDDIRAQPETLSRLCREYATGDLHEALRRAASVVRASPGPVCLTGMGASYFALVAAKALLDRSGVPARLEDTAYLVEYGHPSIGEAHPVVLVSQSGRTGDALGLRTALGDHRPLILVTNDPNTELAETAEVVLPLLASPDQGVALKTYTASLALLLMLAAEIAGGRADDIAASLLVDDWIGRAIAASERNLEAMLEFAGDSRYTTLLGRGPSIASALGGALLLKETAKVPAEGANAGQFRHGAIEVIFQGSFAVMFAPRGRTSDLNRQLTAKLERAGARVLYIGPPDGPSSIDRLVMEIDTPDEYLAPVFEIVPLQLLSYALALRRGIKPGTFVNTTPVVLTR